MIVVIIRISCDITPVHKKDNTGGLKVLSLERSCLEGLPLAGVWGPGFPKCYKTVLRYEIFEKNYLPHCRMQILGTAKI